MQEQPPQSSTPAVPRDHSRRGVCRRRSGEEACWGRGHAESYRAVDRRGVASRRPGAPWRTFDVGSEESARSPLREVLRRFFAAGARVIDSSPMYGNAETVVGDLIRGTPWAHEPFIATKVWASGRDAGEAQMTESERRMGGHVDLMESTISSTGRRTSPCCERGRQLAGSATSGSRITACPRSTSWRRSCERRGSTSSSCRTP